MAGGSPHFPVREDWLAMVSEEVLAPEQVILDAHHHLWDRSEGRYRAEELHDDLASGHDVRASVFVQCRTGYRADLPAALQPLGEVETVLNWCGNQPNFPAAIVAFADLQLGEGIRPVLDALMDASGGLVRGIRNTTAFHSHPAVRSNPTPPPDGLLRSSAFFEGARVVAEYGLSLDVWAYQSQLDEVFALAKALPELSIIVDHCGGPLSVGPYDRRSPAAFEEWRKALQRLASLSNTRLKIGGFGLSVMGYRYADAPVPPQSSVLASDWAPYFSACLECFGPQRAMFESNFPVDKGQFAYRTLWNAFKRLSADFDQSERDDLFWRTAARTYRIDDQIFVND
ncbi:amidohydrolase family protein [Roseibium suaedae]|uniref:Predicted metal-dependent hydrolase, TIM-barrel fold n=1 Tax=Roseibium suaedae TaxID=735517 RepID=A0A1M7PHM8_9HYPH|nr:amidohydrolase family protein [Roseibium suaedae]SHN16543.1 Predicted metal-dependent hydrolase, TIM-barrel fold [Roseibium suaedae]